MGEDKFKFKGRIVKRDGGRIGASRRNLSNDLMVRSLTPRVIPEDISRDELTGPSVWVGEVERHIRYN